MKYMAFVLERFSFSVTLKNEEKVGSLPALMLKEFTQDGEVGPRDTVKGPFPPKPYNLTTQKHLGHGSTGRHLRCLSNEAILQMISGEGVRFPTRHQMRPYLPRARMNVQEMCLSTRTRTFCFLYKNVLNILRGVPYCTNGYMLVAVG